MEVQLHSPLMLARNGGEWSAPRLCRITTLERPSIVNEYEAKLAPAWVWMFWRSEIYLAPARIQTPNRVVCPLVARPTTEFPPHLRSNSWDEILDACINEFKNGYQITTVWDFRLLLQRSWSLSTSFSVMEKSLMSPAIHAVEPLILDSSVTFKLH